MDCARCDSHEAVVRLHRYSETVFHTENWAWQDQPLCRECASVEGSSVALTCADGTRIPVSVTPIVEAP